MKRIRFRSNHQLEKVVKEHIQLLASTRDMHRALKRMVDAGIPLTVINRIYEKPECSRDTDKTG